MARCTALASTFALLLLLGSAGCGFEGFEGPQRLRNLRILGLSASQSLVEPGTDLTLEALWIDPEPFDEDDVITAWFPGCINPDFGSLENCLDELNDLRAESGAEWPAEFSPEPGSRVEVEVDEQLLAGRESYGIQYFFFAVCHGARFEFAPSKHDSVPIVCRDERGRAVNAPNFRLGYRTVTALPDLPAELPVGGPQIVGFEFDGQLYDPHCRGTDCNGYHEPECSDFDCPPFLPIDPEDDCDSEKDPENCTGTHFRVVLDEESLTVDWLASAEQEELQTVEIHAEYFATIPPFNALDYIHAPTPWGEDGGWDREARSGFVMEPGAVAIESVFLWAVVYDSTGGVSWAGIGVE